MGTEVVELEGHIIDSLTLAKVLDTILAAGADYQLLDVDIGRTSADVTRARIEVRADDDLTALLAELQVHGANRVGATEAELVATDADGVLPVGFYPTTNLPTAVRVDGRWLEVERPEADCALVVSGGRARAVPMHRVRAGDPVVVGTEGVRVSPPERRPGPSPFELTTEFSAEKPKALLAAQVAERVRRAKATGGKVLAVCGPAVVHTGAAPALAALVRAGVLDVVFADNAFAAHDAEANVMGTSLGMSVGEGGVGEGGRANHLRVVNEVRRYGSLAAAVDAGYLDGGVVYECVRAGVPLVLGGSVGDAGPLPDVFADAVQATDAMRYLLPGVAVALVLAAGRHGVAAAKLLAASVETYAVDINPAAVARLTDRGSSQALGIVTDVGLFARELAGHLT